MVTDSYLRFPDIRDDQVVFVADDDLWLTTTDGGRAHRITTERRPVRSPRLSPDGAHVAWTALHGSLNEVYVSDLTGGGSRQLTFWGQDRTFVRGWLSDSEVLVVSTYGEAERSRMFAHAVPIDGSPSRRLPYGWVADLALGPGKGALLSTTTTVEPAYWKGYRGGTAAQLWLDATDDHGQSTGTFTRVLSELQSSLVGPLYVRSGRSTRIGFVSDHEGRAQVYSAPVRRGTVRLEDLQRHTDHEFYARHASSDGQRVVYVAGGSLYLLDSLEPDSRPREIEVQLGGDRPATRSQTELLSGVLDWIAPDRNGRASVVGARGSVQWLPTRNGASRTLADGAQVRRREPQVLGESKRVVWISDSGGDDSIEVLDLTDLDATPRTLMRAGKAGRITELAPSPDGKRLAIATHDGRLLTIAVPAKVTRAVTPKELTTTTFGDLGDFAWSPDSTWLAWSHPGGDNLAQIKLADMGAQRPAPIEVTSLRFNDFSPSFTVDGEHLAFLSYRSFDPIYDSYVFDLSFPGGCRPYLVPLAATTPSPFDAQVDGRPLDGEEGVPGPENPDDTPKEKKPEDTTPRTTVDVEGLAQRLVAFPVDAGRLDALQAVQGGAVWQTLPWRGELGEDLAGDAPRPRLTHIDFATGKTQTLIDAVDQAVVTGDGSRIVVWADGAMSVVPAARKVEADAPDRLEVDLSGTTVTIEPREQWRQMYDEAWRLMRDNFWRADMDGVDWPGARERYLPLLERIGTHDDLVDLLWELQGELGSSHAYVTPVPTGADEAEQQGLLGADVAYRGGRWVIERIVPGESSSRAARSPLQAPGVGIGEGDAIVSIGGRRTTATDSPAKLLRGRAGKPTEIVVAPKRRGSASRRVVITPLPDEMPVRYQAWVNDRRDYVHAQTDGRVGYLHVPDMVSAGWAQLHRDLRTEIGREAVIVDVRANRGGHISQLVIEKLARSIIGWDVSRGMQPLSYPLDARRGPLVAVTDMHAGSDGDIVTAAIREMGLGTVIGTRTWGGVIGIDGRYTLVDGTSVTQPRYAFWFERFGWGVENYGVDPDIEVQVPPQDRVAGIDVQLDAAIALVLKQLASTPAKQPPTLPPPRVRRSER